MKILGIIPSRFASTRFPGKPLIEINGKTMIQRVYEQAKKASALNEVMVATDDERIFNHVIAFGGKVMMTSSSHESGTERCAEVIKKLDETFDVIINIQGDEPFINPKQINDLCNCFNDNKTDIATLVKKIETEDDLFNPNKPKVVFDKAKFALLFSRSCIPFLKNFPQKEWLKNHNYYKHIGIYGYKKSVLKQIAQLPVSDLEKAEGLEQLCWLENDYKIKLAVTELEAFSVDSPEDLKKL